MLAWENTKKSKDVRREEQKLKKNIKGGGNMKSCMVTNMKNKNRKPTGDTHKSDLNMSLLPCTYLSSWGQRSFG